VRLVGDCWITCTKSLAPPCSNNERPAYHSPWSSSSISNVGVLLCHWQPLEIRLSRHRVAETCQGSSIIHPWHKVRVNFLLEKFEYNHRIYGSIRASSFYTSSICNLGIFCTIILRNNQTIHRHREQIIL